MLEVQNLYDVYYTKQGFDTTALRSIAAKGDVRRFKTAVEAAGLASRLPDGYGFRLTRLELIEAQIWLEVNKAAIAQAKLQGIAHIQTIDTAYYYSLFNVAKGTGISPTFTQLDNRTINRILGGKFYGKNYSQRIWKNSGNVAKELKGILAQATTTGQSGTKTAKMIRERYGVTRYEAARLVRTETAHFNFESSQDAYDDIGIERWKFVATLDSRTDDTCGDYDGEVFKIGEGPIIPIHPGCRCVDAPFIDKAYEPDERIMRDPITGKNRYIGNISFAEWTELVK